MFLIFFVFMFMFSFININIKITIDISSYRYNIIYIYIYKYMRIVGDALWINACGHFTAPRVTQLCWVDTLSLRATVRRD